MTYDNTNSGALFRNDKATTEKHPTHTGSINIEGVDYWLSAWVKEGSKGKFFSLAAKPKEEQKQPPKHSGGGSRQTRQEMKEIDDDIPF